jgi:diaminohydroxyphosphoribosylaminopyrimidine deaminase/5-amino-6-(5-phosphoribosylamino)uracil reductase
VKIHENTYSAASNWPKWFSNLPKLMVGSNLYENRIIGKAGIKAGELHEVNAINSVKDKSLLKKATIYV